MEMTSSLALTVLASSLTYRPSPRTRPSTFCFGNSCSASALINQFSEIVFQSMQSSDPLPS